MQEAENKTGIKTETLDIKEETKLMTVEDVSEISGTMTRYSLLFTQRQLTDFNLSLFSNQFQIQKQQQTSNLKVKRHLHPPQTHPQINRSRLIGSHKTSATFVLTENC